VRIGNRVPGAPGADRRVPAGVFGSKEVMKYGDHAHVSETAPPG
jgi:hypothetical protein